jgi:cytoskeletal protein CcmA (bactofilin family)
MDNKTETTPNGSPVPAANGENQQQDSLGAPTSEEEIKKQQAAETEAGAGKKDKGPKQPSAVKKSLRKFNIYLLMFLLVMSIGVVVSVVGYLNSKKPPKLPTIANQELTADTLKQLANSDATVGSSGQTLTVQGNAVFAGQVLVRSDLNVAGNIQLGGVLNVPTLTVSGKTNLADTQINTLQVASTTTLQGTVTVQKDLNVGGTAAFSGPVVAGTITASKIIMSGNGQLQIPNHLSFPGATPARTLNAALLGTGGSATLGGSDTSGTINVNTGNGPSAGCFMTVKFNVPYATTPHVIISPVGLGAALSQYYVERSTTGFSVCSANAPPANQPFAYDYFITGS